MAKTLNALIYPSAPAVIVDRRMVDVDLIPDHKKSLWRPVVIEGDDAFDPLTHKKTGPVTTIEESRVVDTYYVAALSTQEVSDIKDAALGALNWTLYSVVAKVFLNHENRIRALESKSSITMAQFKNGVKGFL